MDLDGIIAIAMPAWVFYLIVLLAIGLVVIDGWKLVLLRKERRERRQWEALEQRRRAEDRMRKELGYMEGERERPATPPPVPWVQ